MNDLNDIIDYMKEKKRNRSYNFKQRKKNF